MATSDWDATGRIWDATTGELVCGLSGHHDRVLGAAALVLAVAVIFVPGLAPGLQQVANPGQMGGM